MSEGPSVMEKGSPLPIELGGGLMLQISQESPLLRFYWLLAGFQVGDFGTVGE